MLLIWETELRAGSQKLNSNINSKSCKGKLVKVQLFIVLIHLERIPTLSRPQPLLETFHYPSFTSLTHIKMFEKIAQSI